MDIGNVSLTEVKLSSHQEEVTVGKNINKMIFTLTFISTLLELIHTGNLQEFIESLLLVGKDIILSKERHVDC